MIPQGAIDCDVHPRNPGRADLIEFLDEHWAEVIRTRDLNVLTLASSLASAKPYAAPASANESDSASLDTELLKPLGLRHAILNCVTGIHALHDPYFVAALATATNRWVAKHYLDADPRLRASIVVSLLHPELAVEEIERWAGDKRFVQVLVLSMGDMPLGKPYFWPVWKAAEQHGLPIGIHAGNAYRHAPTQSGYPSHAVEDFVAQAQGFATQVGSIVTEGVAKKFPTLKFVLIESGVTWLPSLMWRMSKDWRGTRTEIPWVDRFPAEIIRDTFRLTLHPFDGPQAAEDVERALDHFRSDDMILFSTDHPRRHYPDDEALPKGLPERLVNKILFENALATYPRL